MLVQEGVNDAADRDGLDLRCRRDDERRGRGGERDPKRRRPSEPDLEDGQLPEPPSPPAQARDAEMADADEAPARSPRAQEARRCACTRAACSAAHRRDVQLVVV